MRFTILVAIAVAMALYLGGWTAAWAVRESGEIGTVSVGAWTANPFAGAPDADPYSKARLAKVGNLTLGIGEGVLFRAEEDDAGRPLRRECGYLIEGVTPPARIFTLVPFTPDGRLVRPPNGQPGWLTSNNLMREDDNSFAVSVGPKARAGNWLATQGEGPLVLTLSLYDTPVSSASGAASLKLPSLVREGCPNG